VHIEIALPDEAGRLQILKIKTQEMRENGMMASDVNLEDLAKRTKNYSGAEILGLCNAARSYVYARHIKVGTMAALKDDLRDAKVCMSDFENALNDVKPAFGRDDESLELAFKNGIIKYSPLIERILDEGKVHASSVSTVVRL
jgi:vesicle-fusing ATPase